MNTRLGWLVVAALTAFGCSGGSERAASNASAACQPSGSVQYICGPVNAEDIVPIGTSTWLIASGMNGQLSGSDATGHIYLVDREKRSYEEWFPTALPTFVPDRKTFASCPDSIDPKNFSAHGLALNDQGEGRYRLYMTSHGAREAIETFDIDMNGRKPTISWSGCVLLPERTFANSVAILSDGGFVTTKMMDPSVQNAFDEINQGKITGLVYEWHPGGTVTAVPGTDLSGANGIVVSPDEKTMFVSASGTRELVRFDRRLTPVKKDVVQLPIAPDNIRWSADGSLYTIGQNYVPPAECAKPPCSTGWSVFEVDPSSMAARRVAGADEHATLQGASTALRVGNEIWIGTYQGDRIGYLTMN